MRLYKSQPAVSHALAQLRDIFQDPLLTRQGGGMALTPRARELQQPLEAALGQLNALLHQGEFDASLACAAFASRCPTMRPTCCCRRCCGCAQAPG